MIKLDLSKAYDRLNWNYLREVLRAFGFCNRWIEWISAMISSTNFPILMNGTPSQPSRASRGLRQGDPLSPFLFIIVVEGLGRYIKKEVREKKLKGIQIWGNNLSITHQQFVDDIMLFCNVSLREVRRIKATLDIFMTALGTQINNEKSCTYFFNTAENIRNFMTRTLGFRSGELPTRYLGTPLALNPLRISNWQQTIDKIARKLENWSFRTLNFGSRAILVKAVLQSILLINYRQWQPQKEHVQR